MFLVLNKKRILLTIFGIVLSICVVGAGFLNGQGHPGNQPLQAAKQDTVAVVALPVSNKVIILDAGHGLPDGRSCFR